MTDQATITVQYAPFRLTLARGNDGDWHATLRRVTDEPAAPPLVHVSSYSHDAPPRVAVETGIPCLRISDASFPLPPKQLHRIREWIDAQHAPPLHATPPDAEHTDA